MRLSDRHDGLTTARLKHLALALFAVTVAGYGVMLAGADGLIEPGGEIIGRDYLAFFMAGDMLQAGRGADLYDAAAQSAWQAGFMAADHPAWTSTCLYLNPPHFAGAMSWFAPAGYRPSLAIWWGLSLTAFGVTLAFWRPWLRRGTWRNAAVFAMCMPAWFLALAGGQNSFFSLAILTAFCALLLKGRPLAAGLALALLGYKFQFLLVPAAWLVLTRRWRALAGMAIGGALTLALTAVWLGPQIIRDYLAFGQQLAGLMHTDGFDVHKQCSWYGFFYLLGDEWMPAISVRILTATASLACAGLLMPLHATALPAEPDHRQARLSLQLAAMLIVMLLTSPHLFHYDLLLATLPAALWASACREPRIASATRGARGVLIAGFALLAVSGPVADLTRLQVIPPLLAVWLVTLAQAGPARCPILARPVSPAAPPA